MNKLDEYDIDLDSHLAAKPISRLSNYPEEKQKEWIRQFVYRAHREINEINLLSNLRYSKDLHLDIVLPTEQYVYDIIDVLEGYLDEIGKVPKGFELLKEFEKDYVGARADLKTAKEYWRMLKRPHILTSY